MEPQCSGSWYFECSRPTGSCRQHFRRPRSFQNGFVCARSHLNTPEARTQPRLRFSFCQRVCYSKVKSVKSLIGFYSCGFNLPSAPLTSFSFLHKTREGPLSDLGHARDIRRGAAGAGGSAVCGRQRHTGSNTTSSRSVSNTNVVALGRCASDSAHRQLSQMSAAELEAAKHNSAQR